MKKADGELKGSAGWMTFDRDFSWSLVVERRLLNRPRLAARVITCALVSIPGKQDKKQIGSRYQKNGQELSYKKSNKDSVVRSSNNMGPRTK